LRLKKYASSTKPIKCISLFSMNIFKNNIRGIKDNCKNNKTFFDRMVDLLDLLCVKYKRVLAIYSNGRGPSNNYHAWKDKDAYVRLQLMLVGCIGKNMCWKITLTFSLKGNIGSKQRKNRS
jgi:hypothetical protein